MTPAESAPNSGAGRGNDGGMTHSIDSTELNEALDVLAIGRLQSRYGDVITRQAWGELGDLFLPDAPITLDLRRGEPIELVGPVALGEMVAAAVARFEFFEFALLNSVIDVVDPGDAEARTATGRLYMWELRQHATTGRWSNAYGLYEDTYVRRHGRWVIGARHYSSLARSAESDDGAPEGHDYEVFPVPGR